MIRHRPWGSGHSYQVDIDQRSPIHPVAGQALHLGAATSRDVTAVVCELETTHADGNTSTELLVASASDSNAHVDEGATLGGEGHLATAAAAKAMAGHGWAVTFDAAPGARYRYRFVATRPVGTERTRWFTVRVSAWVSADVLAITGDISRVRAGSQEYLTDGERVWGVRFSLDLVDGERVIGFGERFERLNQRGHKLDAQVWEQYTSQGAVERTYLPMPFAHVIGADGWGFHVRTAGRTWFDVGVTAPSALSVEVELDRPLAGDASWLLDMSIFSGAPAEVLDAFLEEAGRPEQLPSWVFRLWASSNEWNTQAEVERQVALHQEHGIPIGSVVIEAWSDETSFTVFRDAQYDIHEDGAPHRLADFTFPADGAWPDPKAMTDALHHQDVRLILWQIPLIKLHRPEAQGQVLAHANAAVRDDVLIKVKGADGSLRPYRNRGWWFHRGYMPDLTDKRAAQWWTERRRYLVEEVGIDGFKTDGGEHAWGGDLAYLDGANGTERNNLFPVAYPAAYGALLKSAGKAPVTFSRAGFTGSQAHGLFWAGDEHSTWEAFRWSMIAGLNASACGVLYWGWDIAGFSGNIPTPELYLRAFAVSAFVPVMQYHSEFNFHRKPSNDRTPWNVAERHGDSTVIDKVRDIVGVRERLVPYLAHQTQLAIQAGTTLMRPLWFGYPEDSAVWDFPLQWMLGDDILVASVVEEGALAWDVYLPQGDWVDAWTGETVAGGGVVHANVSDAATTPVYVRASAWPGLAQVFGLSESTR